MEIGQEVELRHPNGSVLLIGTIIELKRVGERSFVTGLKCKSNEYYLNVTYNSRWPDVPYKLWFTENGLFVRKTLHQELQKFTSDWDGYVNYLVWRGFKLGLKPVSFKVYMNRGKAYLPDEVIAIYKQTGSFFIK